MNSWHAYSIALVAQITAITAIALLALQILRRSAPLRLRFGRNRTFILAGQPGADALSPTGNMVRRSCITRRAEAKSP